MHTDPNSSRQEVTQLETGFMMGLHSRDPATRSKFFDLFHKSLRAVCFFRRSVVILVGPE